MCCRTLFVLFVICLNAQIKTFTLPTWFCFHSNASTSNHRVNPSLKLDIIIVLDSCDPYHTQNKWHAIVQTQKGNHQIRKVETVLT